MMDFNTVPSLLHLSCVKIALRLIQDSDIQKMLDLDIMRPYHLNSFDRNRHELWKLIEKTAMDKLPPLPPTLPSTVAKFIRPMHYEFISWLMDHDLMSERKGFYINYRDFICWQINGTIDRKETAKKYVQDESIDSRDRFIMACNYLFVDEITSIWDIIKIVGVRSMSRRGINSAVRFWMDLLEGGITKPIRELFEEHFHTDNLTISDIPLRLSSYFRFLSQECRRDYFINYCVKIQADDFRLCQYEMNERERVELIRTIPVVVLMNCLDWPYQYLFIKMAKELSEFMVLSDFENVMEYMLNFIFLNEYDYSSLFKQFWDITPDRFKDEMMSDTNGFKPFEAILKYTPRENSQSLVEIVAKCCFE